MAVDIDGYLNIIENASGGEDVRDAIINCMNEINKDAAFTICNKTITSKLSEINKTYSAASGQVWKQVTLNITDDSGQEVKTGNQTKYDFEVNNSTANGSYDAVTEHGEGAVWGNIYVNVDHSGEWDGIIDNVIISTSSLDETGTYNAEDDGYTAVKSVTFSDVDPIRDGGGYYGSDNNAYFDITFNAGEGTFSDGKHSKTVAIQAGDVIAIGETPTKNGSTFMGWKSEYGNTKAKKKETVSAKWGNPIVVDGEIQDSWATIIMSKGASVQIGQYKSLSVELDIPYSVDIAQFRDLQTLVPSIVDPNATYHYAATWIFVKVAGGEGGSESTFLCTQPAYNTNALIPSHITTYDDRYNQVDATHNKSDYGRSKTIEWLNSVFYNNILPAEFRGHLVPVMKYYRCTNSLGINLNQVSQKEIWVPSVKELWITGYDDQVGYPETDPVNLERTIQELYTSAIGQEYGNNWLGWQSGEQRKTFLEKLTNTYAGADSTLRDMSWGSSTENLVKTPQPGAAALASTTVFAGEVASNAQHMAPYIIGFCI